MEKLRVALNSADCRDWNLDRKVNSIVTGNVYRTGLGLLNWVFDPNKKAMLDVP